MTPRMALRRAAIGLLVIGAACGQPESKSLAITHVSLPSRTETLDGTGRFVIPGLWDMHVHMNDAQTGAQRLQWGITGARVMSGGLDATLALREQFRIDPSSGPRLLVVGLALHGTQSFASGTAIASAPTTRS